MDHMKPEIIKAWAFLRENNCGIPGDVIDLMKEAAIQVIDHDWPKDLETELENCYQGED